jgi:hypothetical protein
LDAGYATFPPLPALARLSDAALSSLPRFAVSRPGVGDIQWLKPVDVRGVVVGEGVVLERGRAGVVAEGLRSTPPGSADTRRALRAGDRAVAIVADLDTRLKGLARLVQGNAGGAGARTAAAMLTVSLLTERTSSLPGPAAELEALPPSAYAAAAAATQDLGSLCHGLGDAAGRVALAALDAAGEAQAALLTPGALKPGASQSGHELSVLARTLQAAWAGAGRLVEDVAAAWPAVRPPLFREWLLLFVRAAEAAAAMQRAVGVAGADGEGRGSSVHAASSAWVNGDRTSTVPSGCRRP